MDSGGFLDIQWAEFVHVVLLRGSLRYRILYMVLLRGSLRYTILYMFLLRGSLR